MTIKNFTHHAPDVGARVYICDTAMVIGRVTLAADVSVWPMTVIRGDVNFIEIGRATNVQDGCVFHVASARDDNPEGEALIIGEDVTVGHKVLLHGCRVGNRCLIGMGAIVMDAAVIEDEVLLAAGSLVPPRRRLESGYLYQGRPARRVRPLTQQERDQFVKQAEHYVTLKNQYLAAVPVVSAPTHGSADT